MIVTYLSITVSLMTNERLLILDDNTLREFVVDFFMGNRHIELLLRTRP